MAFNKINSRVATSIGGIQISLIDSPIDGKSVVYFVDILDQDGEKLETDQDSGNLVPHLTQAQIDWLLQFGDDLRAKAETELLP